MYLLDTCSFLWYVHCPQKLSNNIIELLENGSNKVFLSAISVWEVNQKFKLGKLEIKTDPIDFFAKYVPYYNLSYLSFDAHSANILPKLPEIHKDPFDKMLICQSIVHNLTLITNDAEIKQYPIRTIW